LSFDSGVVKKSLQINHLNSFQGGNEMKFITFLVTLGLLIALFPFSSAQVPQLINYQGKLTKASGAPLDTTIQMVFTIYDDSTGGNPLWTETQNSVNVEKGVFNVLLGSSVPVSYSTFNGTIRYLGVKVGGDPEITPRRPIVSVAYAYRSLEADTADYARASPAVPDNDWVINEDNIYHLNGNVGIGTTSPNEQLEITENLRLPATTATAGIIKVGTVPFIHNYGYGNTFVGVNAGNLTMTGYSNTANGNQALSANTTGYYNTADGWEALTSNTTGYYNTATGYQALDSNSTGNSNTANGTHALYSNSTGNSNTANGSQALYSNRTGNYNTANGHQALNYNTIGYYNTANGKGALYSNTTGGGNTALGYGADVSSGSLTNATAIGFVATVDASDKVRIGNTSVTSIGGQVGWTTFSDGRYKKSISENVPGLAFISKLKPVTYTMDVDAIDAVLRPRQPHEGKSQEDLMPSAEEIASRQAQSQIVYTGFIAQEVEQVAKETGYDFSGVDAPKSDKGMYGLRYAEFVVPLVKAVQEQQQLIQEQQVMIQELQKRIEHLEKK
jgi:hypothetical protein